MSISIISDVHISVESDDAHKTMMSFFDHRLVQDSDSVYLLGDIFDLMVGNHKGYLEKHSQFFEKLGDLLVSGKEVRYFEGNHDLHLEKLIKAYLKKNNIDDSKFFVHTEFHELQRWGRKHFFDHGDNIEIGNIEYKKYKAFITHPVLRFVANYIMPYSVLHYFGERASKNSRERGYLDFDEESVRRSYRDAAKVVAAKGYDYIVCGHSHVKDDYSEGSFVYLNNGYAPASKSFILLDSSGHKFVNLEES